MDYKIKMFKYLVSNICFITDNLLPNYLEKPVYYRFRDGPLAFTGKYIHTAYNYWILKNAGVNNIKLITNTDDIGDDDILFLWCCRKKHFIYCISFLLTTLYFFY